MLVLMSVSAIAIADGGTGGLGSSSPPVPNVSANAQYQVFRWVQSGVTYVQVNDAAGNVKFAVAAGGGVVLVLPVGSPEVVQVMPGGSAAATAGAPVYQDSAVTITTSPTGFAASPTASSPVTKAATTAACGNPADCSQVNATPGN